MSIKRYDIVRCPANLLPDGFDSSQDFQTTDLDGEYAFYSITESGQLMKRTTKQGLPQTYEPAEHSGTVRFYTIDDADRWREYLATFDKGALRGKIVAVASLLDAVMEEGAAKPGEEPAAAPADLPSKSSRNRSKASAKSGAL